MGGWGEAHAVGAGTSRSIENAHKALDKAGIPSGPLADRAVEAANLIRRLFEREKDAQELIGVFKKTFEESLVTYQTFIGRAVKHPYPVAEPNSKEITHRAELSLDQLVALGSGEAIVAFLDKLGFDPKVELHQYEDTNTKRMLFYQVAGE